MIELDNIIEQLRNVFDKKLAEKEDVINELKYDLEQGKKYNDYLEIRIVGLEDKIKELEDKEDLARERNE